jgi:predicted O-methyltransferase YrrM
VRGRDRPGPHIFIAIPCHGEISAPTFAAFFEGGQMLDAAGFNITLCIEAGNCHVDDARNSLVREFLKTDCTDLVFIDADVGFRCEDLLKLVSVDRDVVGGVYPKKEDVESFPVLTIPGPLQADGDGLVEVEGVPTGFLRIKRHVLEKLGEDAVSFIGQAGDPVPYRVIYERIVSGGQRRSGDYAFCHKWRELGGRIFVDPEMEFTHTGAKTWSGTLGAYWKRKNGVEAAETVEAFGRAVGALKSGNPKAEDFIALTRGWGNGWSASPELLIHLFAECNGTVIECGSGLSTLVMAAKGCRVIAYEHDPVFGAYTRAMLGRFGLDELVTIHCAPLKDGWYDVGANHETAADALVIDGPPRQFGNRSEAVERFHAPLIFWDDYETGLSDPEIVEGQNRFAILRSNLSEAA